MLRSGVDSVTVVIVYKPSGRMRICSYVSSCQNALNNNNIVLLPASRMQRISVYSRVVEFRYVDI